MITLTGIAKRFGGITALEDVSLAFAAGRVHGILGENGAGKSTLMNVLFGLVQPDAGTIAVDGAVVRIASPRDARRLGIGMVHQHFKLVPTLSVADNAALALQASYGRIARAQWRRSIHERAQRLRWAIDPAALVATLGIGQQQRVELLIALLGIERAGGARTLILDEPTAVLTPGEVDELLPALRALAADGVAVVYISHKLAEIGRVCDEVSVLRRGRLVHQGPAGAPVERLAELMLGAAPARLQRVPRPAAQDARALITLAGVGVGAAGRPLLAQVSLTLRAGEVVGIAGVEGNGQAPLVQLVLRQLAPTQGQAALAVGRADIGVIPDDRQREALVLALPVDANLGLKRYRQAPLSRCGWLAPRAWLAHARALMAAYDVRGPGPEAAVATLSGGNQQKAVVARELEGDPPLIVAVNPTRGLDVGAAQAVLARLVAARDGGAGVLLVHSDLDELLAVSDRVLVLHDGRLADSGWPVHGREAIGRMMLGGGPPAAGDQPPVAGDPPAVAGDPPAAASDRPAVAEPRRWRVPAALAASGIALGAIAVAGALVLLGLAALGHAPWDVLATWAQGAAGNGVRLAMSLQEAGPLLLTGLAAAVAFRCGVWNIGGEGQFLLGAVTMVALGTRLQPPGPGWLALPFALLLAAGAGAAYAVLANALERWRGVPVVLSTILLNFIAVAVVGMLVQGPLHDPATSAPQTALIAEHLRLPLLAEGSRLHAGVLVALALAGGVWLWLARTVVGFEVQVVGLNPDAARLAGMPVASRQRLVMALSGGLAGFAGAAQVAGVTGMLSGSPLSYGYAGIAVALLGRLHPMGVVAAALFMGMLGTGARHLERRMGIPHDLADVVQGLVVLAVVVVAGIAARRALRPHAEAA